MKIKTIKKINKCICTTMGVFLLLGGFLAYEDTALSISEHTIKNEKIPKVFNDFKIIQISDFHNTKNKLLTDQIVIRLLKEKPDAIFITGDFVDANTPDIEASVNFLKQIKDIAPIYYIPGNHEGHLIETEYLTLKNNLLANDVFVLENELITIKRDGEQINIIGVLDPIFSNATQSNKAQKMRININKIEYDDDLFTILLSHRPELINVYSDYDIDLVFSGHAHGGQIRVPFVGGLYAPGQGKLPKLTSGIHKDDDTTMVISRGIGNSTFPFRINNHPEIVIVNLGSE